MAFFSKLKERLFESSSKIEEGLDAIVADGGVREAASRRGAACACAGAGARARARPRAVAAARDAGAAAAGARDPARAGTRPPARARAANRPRAPREVPEPPPSEVPQWDEPAWDPGPSEVPPTMTAPAVGGRRARQPRPGFLGRLFGRGSEQTTVVRRVLDDAMLESLEELLIQADMGVDTAVRVTANIAEGRFGRKRLDPRAARRRWRPRSRGSWNPWRGRCRSTRRSRRSCWWWA